MDAIGKTCIDVGIGVVMGWGRGYNSSVRVG